MIAVDKILNNPPTNMTEVELIATLREGMAQNQKEVEAKEKARTKKRSHSNPDPVFWQAQLQQKIDAKLDGGITIGYWRVSLESQEEQGHGPELQRQAIIAWVVSNTKRAEVDLWIFDICSGSEENRVGLNFLRNAWESGAIAKVVFYRHDRLSRLQRLSEALHRSAKTHGVKLISATESIPQGPGGIMFRQIIQAFSQYERAVIKERMKRGKIEAVTVNGLFAGPVAPYGYAIANGNLVVAESEAAVIRLIFQLHFRGYNLIAISQFLNENDVAMRHKNPTGWTTARIHRTISMQSAYRAEEIFGRVFKEAAINVLQPAILPCRDRSERSPVIVPKLPQGTRIPLNFLSDDPIVPRLLRGKPEKANTILLAIHLRGTGMTYQEVANRLNKLHLTTQLDRKWCATRVGQYWTQKAMWIAAAAAVGVTEAVMPMSPGEPDTPVPAGAQNND